MRTPRFSAPVMFIIAVVGLTACDAGDDPSSASSPSPSAFPTADAETLAAIEWTEPDDGIPVLTFKYPLSVAEPVAWVMEDGDGDVIESDMILAIDYVVFSGVDGSVVYSTYENGTPDNIVFTEATVDPSMWETLHGSHVGTRFFFAAPDSSAEVGGANPSVVAAMTVMSANRVYERAEGEAVTSDEGLPQVTLAENGMPNIDFAGADMPSSLVVQPLIVGAGDSLEQGQTLMAHYKGWLWDGEFFDCSWARGTPATFAFVEGNLIHGWIEGLEGQPVGSQVLLIIPPELGYGDTDQGPIPAGSTLVFVIDILAAF